MVYSCTTDGWQPSVLCRRSRACPAPDVRPSRIRPIGGQLRRCRGGALRPDVVGLAAIPTAMSQRPMNHPRCCAYGVPLRPVRHNGRRCTDGVTGMVSQRAHRADDPVETTEDVPTVKRGTASREHIFRLNCPWSSDGAGRVVWRRRRCRETPGGQSGSRSMSSIRRS